MLKEVAGTVSVGPVADVREVEPAVLDLKDAADVFNVLGALSLTRPAELGDDDVFGGGHEGGLAADDAGDATAEAFLVVQVVAEEEELDKKIGVAVTQAVTHRRRNRFEGHLWVELEVGADLADEGGDTGVAELNDEVGILGRARLAVDVS